MAVRMDVRMHDKRARVYTAGQSASDREDPQTTGFERLRQPARGAFGPPSQEPKAWEESQQQCAGLGNRCHPDASIADGPSSLELKRSRPVIETGVLEHPCVRCWFWGRRQVLPKIPFDILQIQEGNRLSGQSVDKACVLHTDIRTPR